MVVSSLIMDQNVLIVCILSVALGVTLIIVFLLRKQQNAAIEVVAKLEQRLADIEAILHASPQTDELSAAQSESEVHSVGERIHIKKRPADMSSITEQELFQYISTVIIKEELFRWPDFNRNAVIERFSLSPARVGAVFSRGGGQSLPEFVRCCRLDYTCRLMVENPHLSFTEIGESAGFQRTTTFYHDFKARFGMAPAEYRKTKLKSKTLSIEER